MTSPYDDGWLTDSLYELGVEIALNDPRTLVIKARSVLSLALVCSRCHVILKREPWSGDAVAPAQEKAHDHTTGHGPLQVRLGVEMFPHCDGSGKPAQWHPIAED